MKDCVIESSIKNGTATITVDGTFDIHMAQEFINQFKQLKEPASNLIVNLSNTQHIDSSALGSIVKVKKLLGKDQPMRLSGAKGQVMKSLKTMRMHELCQVDGL